jgi:hypothetical protein
MTLAMQNGIDGFEPDTPEYQVRPVVCLVAVCPVVIYYLRTLFHMVREFPAHDVI